MDNIKHYIKSKWLIIFEIFCVLIVAGIIGYTYSFFTATVTDSVTIRGEAASLNLSLTVTKISPSNNNGLIPQLDDYITNAVIGRKGSCIDDNNNNVCQVYKITLKNNSAVTVYVNGTLTLNAKNNPNLKWAMISGTINPTLTSNINTHTFVTLTENELYTAQEEKNYYIVLWISETGGLQTDNGIFNGVVKFEDTDTATNTQTVQEPIDNSGANYPILGDALIPVVYNETAAKWVKADTESSTSTYGWYDYTQKKWANAILVSENGIRYATTEKTANISNNTTTLTGYLSNNKNIRSSTATSTFTITTGTETGTLSFDYMVSSESGCDKLTITVNGTTIANAISGYQSKTYSVSATANTTYTIVATYKKDTGTDAGADIAAITNLVMPTGSTLSITNGDTYYFAEGSASINGNQIGNTFAYENNKYVLKSIAIGTEISSSTVDKYICSDITQAECTIMYKVTEADTNITKVIEYSDVSTANGVRTTYKNAEAGTEINDSDILAFYVWIPRYKYKVWNKDKVVKTDSYNAQTTGIDIVFESGTNSTGTISCTYDFNVDSANGGINLSTATAETCTGANGDYYTHPAFTFGDNEIKGFWIGKYELSSEKPTTTSGGGSSTTLTPRILPGVNSWRKNRLPNFNTVIQNMQKDSNIYGLRTDKSVTDSHMLTNMEWGAVAYLTNSNYGRCSGGTCTEVTINNCSSYMTGIGGDTVSASSSATTCTTNANKYNGEKGVLASTTGNVYGVYDMSGGSGEFTMGNSSSTANTYTFNASSAGGFASGWYDNHSNQKYVTTYVYSSEYISQTAYNRARLGDATGEVVSSTGGSGGWYSDYAYFPYSGFSWFTRSGACINDSRSGIFYFYNSNGTTSGGTTTRAALVCYS